jgi:sodium/hydrogen exchanger 8
MSDADSQDINYAISTKNHEFGALNTLLLVVILGLCILAAYLIKQNSFYYLPESAAAILVGLMVGGLAR